MLGVTIAYAVLLLLYGFTLEEKKTRAVYAGVGLAGLCILIVVLAMPHATKLVESLLGY